MNRLRDLIAATTWLMVGSGACLAEEKMVKRIYSVADLIQPFEVQGKVTSEVRLIAQIRRSIAPASWDAAGGSGVIEYYPLGHQLVVSQSAAVQIQIEKYLEARRAIQNRFWKIPKKPEPMDPIGF